MSTSLSPARVVELLRVAPDRIAELTADASPTQLRAVPEPGEWSAVEVLAHLRACADVWGGCIVTMLTEERPSIRAVNPRRWIDQTAYGDLAHAPSLQAFTAQRVELLRWLEPLPPAGWDRTATVTGAGRPIERTVLDYADRLARHERTHLKQIEATVRQVTAS